MDSTIIQSAVWIAAGGIMVLFLKRRRSRKTTR
jgi:hypothetical protein